MNFYQRISLRLAALVLLPLIAAAGGWLAIYLHADGASPVSAGSAEGPTYRCAQCGKDFCPGAEAFSFDPGSNVTPTQARQPHCPLCGARHAGLAMARCPRCRGPYVPAAMLGRGGGEACPHCGNDMQPGAAGPAGAGMEGSRP